MTIARRASAVIAAGGAFGLLAGVALGVLWWRLAPRVPLVVRPGESYPQGYQPDGYLGADVSFAILAMIAGVAVTIGLLAMRREHLISVLIASLLAGGLGSVAMWFVGGRLGSVDIEGLSATTTADVVVDAPLHVSMPAVLLLWPLTAAGLVTVMAFGDWWTQVRAGRRGQSAP
ncbi:MAG: hypothetical protein KGP12_04330 [Actinomycetales bacterium]|nr:hypothetical protein [Actinomycetales bacterium]